MRDGDRRIRLVCEDRLTERFSPKYASARNSVFFTWI